MAASNPLAEHVKDWRAALLAKGVTPRHADLVAGRVKRVFDGCGFIYWSNLSASRVMAFLADLRADRVVDGETKRGLGAQTFNFYLVAAKSFCRWMVKERRASENPLAHLDGLNVRLDRRHDRRALDVEELRRLLEAATKGGEAFGMTGPARAMLYRVAVESGLRRGELASLTRASFDHHADDGPLYARCGWCRGGGAGGPAGLVGRP